MGNFCSSLDSTDMYEDGGRFVIQLIGASDIPKADVTSESDPYVKAYLIEGGVKSKPFKTSFKIDNPNPVWNAYHDFRISYRVTLVLRIEVWDSDFSSPDDLIGDINIPLEQLRDESVKEFPLNYHIGSSTTNPNFKVCLRRVFIDAPPPMKKTIFLLRHGESKWNEAQADKNFIGLVDMDHSLSKEGVDQAAIFNASWKRSSVNGGLIGSAAKAGASTPLTSGSSSTMTPGGACSPGGASTPSGVNGRRHGNERRTSTQNKRVTFSLPDDDVSVTAHVLDSPSARDLVDKQTPAPKYNYEDLMTQSDKIYVSPLTRAIETALICLQDHPVLTAEGVVLYR
jgi:hypothetical protein